MTSDERPAWVADPSVSWTILLTARLDDPPSSRVLDDRSRELTRELRWPPPPAVLVGGDVDAVRRELMPGDRRTPFRLGRADDALVVAAHHSHVDGIGLLGLLGRILDQTVTSSARGVADRPTRSGVAAAAVSRLGEALAHPPARLVGSVRGTGIDGEVLAERAVEGRVRVAELAHAAVRAASGRLDRNRPVALALGASRRSGAQPDIVDRSALLRLTDVGRDDLGGLRERIAAAPVEPDVSHPTGAASRGVLSTALRVLRPRLGSTLLVSHLGEVEAPGVHELSFHPVSGGGSGVALGAVGLAGRTVLGLRARGSTHAPADLDALLEDVAARLRRS